MNIVFTPANHAAPQMEKGRSYYVTIPSLRLETSIMKQNPEIDEDELKEWAWNYHKDSILASMTIEYDESKEDEKQDVFEEASRTHVSVNESPQSQEVQRNCVIVEKKCSTVPAVNGSRQDLLDCISRVQRQFFEKESPKVVFGRLLEALLDLMQSEYGFIGEVKYEDDGTMFLQTHAITNIAWNSATHKFYEDNINQGLKFYNLNSLFGNVLTSKEPVIANEPKKDSRAAGIPSGHPPLNHFLGIPFFKNDGELHGMVGISNKPGGYNEDDIEFLEPFTVTCSNLIEAYKQINRNNELINTLEEKVKERTQELQEVNANLECANRKIRQNAEMQLQHFACMSHEIRTPLNCIIGMSSLLKETEMTAMQAESMSMIVASGDLLLAIVNDVLDYAKLGTGNAEISITRSNLQETLVSMLHSIEMKAQSRNQSIKATYDTALPQYVHIDSRRIQQILFNLLGNAIKFSPDDSTVEFSVEYVTVNDESDEKKSSGRCPMSAQHVADKNMSLSCENTNTVGTAADPPSGCPFHKMKKEEYPQSPKKVYAKSVCKGKKYAIRFTVKDYGKGIKKSDFNRIFQPFHQATGGDIDTLVSGTGLGLAITHELIRAMGGDISVDSDYGKWSKFTVNIPCVDSPINPIMLSYQMKKWTVCFVGGDLVDQQNARRIFSAFKIDLETFETMESMRDWIERKESLKRDKNYLCLAHEDSYTAEVFDLLLSKSKAVLITFGPNFVHHDKAVHHFRSLSQFIPASLLELIIAKCSGAVTLENTMNGDDNTGHSFENLTILAAEDNVVNQKVLRRMLNQLGIKNLDIVGNGKLAVEREAVKQYDIILMDHQMPVMGGVQACREILKRSGGHKLPKVVFVTAHVSPAFEEQCRQAGCTAFVPKPYKIENMVDCFTQLMRDTPLAIDGEEKNSEDFDVPYSRLRVLVLEEGKMNQKVLEKLLNKLGISSIDFAISRNDAMNQVARQNYDVILIDYQCSGGAVAIKEISEYSINRDSQRIILMSENVTTEFEATCEAVGCTVPALKPYQMDQINESFRSLWYE